jgi:phosphoribosylformylglycinamidine synthase
MGAGVVRIKGTPRALAMSVDGNGRYCYLDPRRGAMLAVAEAARNVACAGATPIGATNCLNFGNPERPEIMWQIVEAIEGIAEACRALDAPITGGNVSLYNETDGNAIYPTPVLGVVGLIEDGSRVLSRTFKGERHHIVLLGDGFGELGGSEYLKVVHDVVKGQPPALDLERESSLIRLLVKAAAAGLLQSAHDCSDGGLAVTLAECSFNTGIGLDVDVPAVLRGCSPGSEPAQKGWTPSEAAHATLALFGESASRAVVSLEEAHRAQLMKMAAEAGVPLRIIGRTGGSRLLMRVDGRDAIDLSLAEAEQVWATAIERYFTGRAA